MADTFYLSTRELVRIAAHTAVTLGLPVDDDTLVEVEQTHTPTRTRTRFRVEGGDWIELSVPPLLGILTS